MLRSVSIALPLSLADRFGAIINALRAVFAEQKPVGPTLLDHIDWKLREVLNRFLFLVTQIEAGTLRLYRPRLAMSRAAASGPVEKRLRWKDPIATGFGWLMWQVWRNREPAQVQADAMRALLAEPDMQALIAKAPVPLGRVLRRLCYMLQIDSRGLLPPPTRRRSAAQVAEAETAPADSPKRKRMVRTRVAIPSPGSLPQEAGGGVGVENVPTPAGTAPRPQPVALTDISTAREEFRRKA